MATDQTEKTMDHYIYNYFEGTHSRVDTRGVVIGFHHRRPNSGCVLLTQTEYARLLAALQARMTT